MIAATVARAVNGLDGACNAIGGRGCPVGPIGGCPIAYALLLTPGAGVCPGHCHGPRLDKVKPPDVAEGGRLFGCMIGRGGGLFHTYGANNLLFPFRYMLFTRTQFPRIIILA